MSDPLRDSVPLGTHPPGSGIDHQCTGGPVATSWCGRAATLVASQPTYHRSWFSCEAHTEGAATLPLVEWYRRYVMPDYDGGAVRECLVCNNHQICDKYDSWKCGNCGQEYLYDETEPKILLTDVQRELLRQHFEANRAQSIDVVVEQADEADEAPGNWRCQFCGEQSLQRKWKKDQCPKCGRKYDALLAQDEDDS